MNSNKINPNSSNESKKFSKLKSSLELELQYGSINPTP
jgi:hypothetical protein